MAFTGTAIVKFEAAPGNDDIICNGMKQTISVKYQFITCMEEYGDKSFEELRLEDYVANRNRFNHINKGSGFGSNDVSRFYPFRSTEHRSLSMNKPLFGSSVNSPPSGNSGLFGDTVKNPQPWKSGQFGDSVNFPQSGNSSLFGGNVDRSQSWNSSPFGASVYLQSGNSSLFGANVDRSQSWNSGLFRATVNNPQSCNSDLFEPTVKGSQSWNSGPFGASVNYPQSGNSGLFGANVDRSQPCNSGLFRATVNNPQSLNSELFGTTAPEYSRTFDFPRKIFNLGKMRDTAKNKSSSVTNTVRSSYNKPKATHEYTSLLKLSTTTKKKNLKQQTTNPVCTTTTTFNTDKAVLGDGKDKFKFSLQASESGNFDEVVKKFVSSLQELIECPVCYRNLDASVKQCENGHGICGSCFSSVKKCPTCQQPYLPFKPTLLRQILDHLPKPCSFADKGCDKIFFNKIEDHEIFCIFRPTSCKFNSCNWKGTVENVINHVKSCKNAKENVLCEMHFPNVKIKQTYVFEKTQDASFYSAVIFENQLFWKYFHRDSSSKNITHKLYHVPPSKPSHKYYLVVSFNKGEFEFKTCVGASYRTDDDSSDNKDNEITFLVPDKDLERFYDSKAKGYCYTQKVVVEDIKDEKDNR